MGFLDLFRRKPPIRDLGELADFIDGNAAFLTQKGIYEYSRARAGHYSKVMFREPEFIAAVEESRWRAYPLGLAMVAEVIEGALRDDAGNEALTQLAGLKRVVLGVLDRYPVPPEIGAAAWNDARDALALALDQVVMHPPKRVIDIPWPYAERYFALMPIHPKLRGHDFPTIRSYLRVATAQIHDEFTRRADALALAAQLRAEA